MSLALLLTLAHLAMQYGPEVIGGIQAGEKIIAGLRTLHPMSTVQDIDSVFHRNGVDPSGLNEWVASWPAEGPEGHTQAQI